MSDPEHEPTTPLLPPPHLVEIPTGDFRNYFFERNRRLFPRFRLPPSLRDVPDAPLPSVLPVDAADMERREVLNNLVALALNCHWFGPFVEQLRPPAGKLVLDIGCANGRWIENVLEVDEISPLPDMQFHEVNFYGVEIVPFTTELPHNVTFEVADFQQDRIPRDASSVDVVHARFQNFHIQDWPKFFKEVARVLKPGGLFMSGELDIPLQSRDGQPLDAPATNQLYHSVQNLMQARGYTPGIGSEMVERLQNATDPQGVSLFTDIHSQVVTFPMSRNNNVTQQIEISTLAMEYLDRLAKSLRVFLLSTGQAQVEVDGLLNEHRRELRFIHATMSYRIAWAKRR